MSTSIAHFEAPKDPQGLVVFYAGNNGTAPNGTNNPNYWDHWWKAALERGFAVASIESPGVNWTIENGPAEDEVDLALEVVKLIRRWYLGNENLPTWHIGFSNGTGVSSMLGYLDPHSQGFAMLCAAGRLEAARNRTRQVPFFVGYGGRDKIVLPTQTEARIEDWERVIGADSDHLIKVMKLGTKYHTPHPNYISPCFSHLGIVVHT